MQDEKSEDDSSYWNQYDQISSGQTLSVDAPKEITSSPRDAATYYSRYDDIETAIGDSDAIRCGETDNHSVGFGRTIPVNRDEGLESDIEDYIKKTVRNLTQFALRCGISKVRLTEIINENIN